MRFAEGDRIRCIDWAGTVLHPEHTYTVHCRADEDDFLFVTAHPEHRWSENRFVLAVPVIPPAGTRLLIPDGGMVWRTAYDGSQSPDRVAVRFGGQWATVDFLTQLKSRDPLARWNMPVRLPDGGWKWADPAQFQDQLADTGELELELEAITEDDEPPAAAPAQAQPTELPRVVAAVIAALLDIAKFALHQK